MLLAALMNLRPAFCTAIFVSVFFALPAHAQGLGDGVGISPFERWKTIESEHFRVTYPERLRTQAQLSAKHLEEAHRVLSPRLYWAPRTKVQVTLLDNSDFANGLAAPVQRIGLVLWMLPPESWFSTTYYDDWLRMLAFHEYTHYLNMDAARDLWAGLRVLFGDTLLPNSIWPPWMLEGLAVYMETRYTAEGRGRSPFYEMILRAAVEEGVLDDGRFITLDKINGTNPWYPDGETPYLFGYQLMNAIARNPIDRHPQDQNGRPVCWDGKTYGLRDAEDQLGVLSLRSSWRVPFFINGNLWNVTGKDFYTFWREWAAETRARMGKDLAAIRAEPVTKLEALTTRGNEAFGATVSPDGRWIAYTLSSEDRRPGLYLRDQATGKSERLDDKLTGVGMAFTPDSKALIYSEVRVRSVYKTFSDLAVREMPNGGGARWLTDGLRARDPDVSRDGRWVTFAVVDHSTDVLARAPLERDGKGRLKLGRVQKIYVPPLLGRVANPKFSPDGTKIAFSLKKNGARGEAVAILDLKAARLDTLVDDGQWNRFPAFAPSGALYFISSRSGVDNLYHWNVTARRAERASNITTGLWFPTFAPDGSVVASHYSSEGFNLARFTVPAQPLAETKVSPAPGPIKATPAAENASSANYPEKDYSVFPSIWPRSWAPGLLIDSGGIYAGGAVFGYDALDLHRYALGAAYDSQVGKPDALALYSNRQLGVTLTALGTLETRNRVSSGSQLAFYERRLRASLTASYPLRWTFTTLTPALGFNFDQTSQYTQSGSLGNFERFNDPTLRSADIRLGYSNAEHSALGVSPEGGRSGLIGVRAYDDGGDLYRYKFLAKHGEYWRLTPHTVLVPFAKASYVSSQSGTSIDPSVQLTGRSARVLFPFDADGFDQLTARGYPDVLFVQRSAVVAGMEYRFPLSWIYRGWGTNPLFFESLHGMVFGEATYFPSKRQGVRTLPSAGGGLRLDLEAFVRLPIELAVDYHYGFRKRPGLGGSDLFFSAYVSQSIF